jgi:PAT family beta-lactamase induction signal transducer AmpG
MLGLLLFGVVADLVGPLRLLRFAFALAALFAGAMLLLAGSWASPWPVTLFTIGVMVCRTMAMVPNGALAMGLCVPAVAATQMTLFNASGNLGMSIGTALLGTLDRLGGHPAMVASMLVFSAVALLLVLAKRRDAKAAAGEAVADAA